MASLLSPFPQGLVDGAQVVGAIIGVVALLVALVALLQAEKGLVRERRIAHELEVLRGLAALDTFTNLLRAAVALEKALTLLPDREDFPLTRVAVGLPAAKDAERIYKEQYPQVRPLAPGTIDSARLHPLILDGVYDKEWTDAINRRLTRRRSYLHRLRGRARTQGI
jgi:hypothetical protein